MLLGVSQLEIELVKEQVGLRSVVGGLLTSCLNNEDASQAVKERVERGLGI